MNNTPKCKGGVGPFAKNSIPLEKPSLCSPGFAGVRSSSRVLLYLLLKDLRITEGWVCLSVPKLRSATLARKSSPFPKSVVYEAHSLVPGRLPAWTELRVTWNEQCATCF